MILDAGHGFLSDACDDLPHYRRLLPVPFILGVPVLPLDMKTDFQQFLMTIEGPRLSAYIFAVKK